MIPQQACIDSVVWSKVILATFPLWSNELRFDIGDTIIIPSHSKHFIKTWNFVGFYKMK